MQTEALTETIIRALDDTKAEKIVKMDLRGIENCFCKVFIICHGRSTTHVSALADKVDDKVREELGDRPLHTEGAGNSSWVILDYGDAVVHIFLEEERRRYQLEELWADAEITEVEGELDLN